MTDAAEIKPKFVPDEALLPRDNSGGLNFKPHTGQWDDSGYVFQGSKSYLDVPGGHSGSGKNKQRDVHDGDRAGRTLD